MIIKNFTRKPFEWCPRPDTAVKLYPDISFDKLNSTNNDTINKLIKSIKLKLNKLNDSPRKKKVIKNTNTIKTLTSINNCLTNANEYIDFIIYNYDPNIHIEVIKNFFVIDCLHSNNDNKNFKIQLNNTNIKKLSNDITLGFINFNHFNNNNRILLDFALNSLAKYNDINKFKFIIINDNKYGASDYISTKSNFKCYDIKNLNKINFNFVLPANFIDISHSIKIDMLINLCKTKYLFLCDCDIIFKHGINEYIELLQLYDIVGEMGYDKIYPFFVGLNIETLRKNHFIFGDIKPILDNKDFITFNNIKENIDQFKFKNINLDDIIYHYGGASAKSRLDKSEVNLYTGQDKYIDSNIKNLSIDEFINLYYKN